MQGDRAMVSIGGVQMHKFLPGIALSLSLVVGSPAFAESITCTDPNVGGSGWRQVASCTRANETFSCTVTGSGPGQGFVYAASGTGRIVGYRPGRQALSAKWTGKGFVGNYVDGNKKSWPIRLGC